MALARYGTINPFILLPIRDGLSKMLYKAALYIFSTKSSFPVTRYPSGQGGQGVHVRLYLSHQR